MLRRIPLSVVALLVALVLAGCSSGGDGGDGADAAEGGGGENPVTSTGDPAVAATVNGTDIPVADVEAEFARLESNPQAQEQLANDPDGAVRRDAEASIVSQLISAQLLQQVAGELGVEVGEAEVAEARAGIIEQVGGEEAFNQIITEQGIAEEDLQRILEQTATQTAVGEALVEDDAAVQAYFEQNADSFGPSAQVRHILVEEEAVAQQALERIRGGEDFATVATELSTDTGSAANGGDLGAVTPGQTVPPFDEAVFSGPIGELQGPVQTEFGFHVIEVTERSDEAPDLESVREQLREDPSPLFGARLQEAGTAAEVVVNPRFGTWDPATGQVTPTDPLGEVAPPSEGAGAPPGGAPGSAPGGAPPQGGGSGAPPPSGQQAPPTDAPS